MFVTQETTCEAHNHSADVAPTLLRHPNDAEVSIYCSDLKWNSRK